MTTKNMFARYCSSTIPSLKELFRVELLSTLGQSPNEMSIANIRRLLHEAIASNEGLSEVLREFRLTNASIHVSLESEPSTTHTMDSGESVCPGAPVKKKYKKGCRGHRKLQETPLRAKIGKPDTPTIAESVI